MVNSQSKLASGSRSQINGQVYSIYEVIPGVQQPSQMISVMGPKMATNLTPKRLSQKGIPPRPIRSPKQPQSDTAGHLDRPELKLDQVHSGSASTELNTGGPNQEKDLTSSGSHSQGYEESDRSILEIQASIQKELQDGPMNNPLLLLKAFTKPSKSTTVTKQVFGGDRDTEDEASPILNNIKIGFDSPGTKLQASGKVAIHTAGPPVPSGSRHLGLGLPRPVPNTAGPMQSGVGPHKQQHLLPEHRGTVGGIPSDNHRRTHDPREKNSAAKGLQQLK